MNTDYESNKEEMILKHMPLVKKVVDRLSFSSIEMDKDDLISIGMIGLMDAVEKYDPKKGVPFEGYARLRIKGTIIDELRKAGKVSRNRIKDLNDYYEEKAAMEQEFLRSPTEEEICQRMGISYRELQDIHQTVNILPAISLEGTLFSGEKEFNLYAFLEDKKNPAPEARLLEKEKKEILKKALEKLDKREQALLNMYYVEELTLREISYVLDISVPRVSQIHGKALLKLRKEIASMQGAEEKV